VGWLLYRTLPSNLIIFYTGAGTVGVSIIIVRLLSSDYTLNIDALIILDDTGEQDKFHWPKFGLMDEKGEDG